MDCHRYLHEKEGAAFVLAHRFVDVRLHLGILCKSVTLPEFCCALNYGTFC